MIDMNTLLATAASIAATGGAGLGSHARSMAGSNWSLDVWLVAPLSLMVILYAAGLVRLQRAGSANRIALWRKLSFGTGMLTLFVALVSPLAELGERIFSLHMGQHELLVLVAAPLLVMATPMPVMMWGLPAAMRARVAPLFHHAGIVSAWKLATGAVFALLIHAVVLWVWHIPALWETALANEAIHAFQHITFFATAGLFWWAIVHGRYGRVGYGVAVVFVFITAMHSSLLGALLTFAPDVWYPSHERPVPGWSLTPVEDQQLAGLLMWIPSGVVFMLLGLGLFAAWLGEAERRQAIAASAALPVEEGPQ